MNFLVILLVSMSVLAPATAQAPVSIEEEPRHHLEFQNEYVHLFYVRIASGDTTFFHTHVHDNIGIRLTDAELSDVVPRGNAVMTSVNRGAVGFGRYPTPLVHRVSNVGSTPFHNIVVELLPSNGVQATAPTLADVSGHTLEMENGRVRIFRLVLAPGQSTEEHAHALHSLVVVITEGKIAVDRPGTKTATVTLEPGDYRWHQGGMRHSLRNAGATTFEAVEIELKAGG